MNLYIYDKVNKESLHKMLKEIGSPLAKLFKHTRLGKENVSKILNEFMSAKDISDHDLIENMKLIEAQALIGWIYKSITKVKEREDATKELMELLRQKYQLQGEILISQGIAYLETVVDLNFIPSFEGFFSSFKEMPSIGENIFYRGHSEANHILIPSLMRKQSWLQNERKMYNELVIKCPECFEKKKSHLEYLVEMQHYGLPTRLLDITTNALVALYFACANNLDSFGEIVVFSAEDKDIKYPQSDTVSILASLPMFDYDKQQEIYEYASDKTISQEDFNVKVQRLLHEVKTEKPAFKDEIIKEDLLHSLIVLPLKNNNRILKQDGAFILCGLAKDYRHLDVKELRYKDSKGKRQIYIVQNKVDILKALNAFGINKSTLFPEIDDVADYIKSKY